MNKKLYLQLIIISMINMISFCLSAATVHLDDYWNGSANNLQSAFTSAENAAGNNGTVQLSSKTYLSTGTIVIKKTITIQGTGKNSTIVKINGATNKGVFEVEADNVTFRDMTLDANGSAKHGIRTGKNDLPPASKNLSCYNLKVINHTSHGLWPGGGNALDGLYVEGCDFHSDYDNAYPHIFIANRKWSSNPMNSMEPFIIKNCTFSGKGDGTLNAANSVEFDGGNDDVNKATDLQGSLVTGCTFEKTAKWQISWVECKNVSVTHCTFEGTLGTQAFAQPIHLEQYCDNIVISDNVIHQNNPDSDHIWAGGSDHGTPVPGPANCKIINNTFTGTARYGYYDGVSTTANGNLIANNDLSGATFSKETIKIKGSNNAVTCNKGVATNQVYFYGGSNNSFTPYSSACEGNQSPESVGFNNPPTTVISIDSISATIDYVAHENRHVVAILHKPTGEWMAVGKQVVAAGSGSIDITIALSEDLQAANDYKLICAIRPVGGNFNSNIDAKEHLFDVVEPVIQTPFSGLPIDLPNKVQAQDYDLGGEGVAFHDTDNINSGNQYRADGVDIEITPDTNGDYNIGWINTGEWLEYTVNVTVSQNYHFYTRMASPTGAGQFSIAVDGQDVSGAVAVPNTGHWQTYSTIAIKNINLTAGIHVVRITALQNGFNFNWWSAWPGNNARLAAIKSSLEELEVGCYPNPTSGIVNLIGLESFGSHVSIIVANITGYQVIHMNVPVRPNTQVDLSGVVPGEYILQVLGEHSSKSLRLSIK